MGARVDELMPYYDAYMGDPSLMLVRDAARQLVPGLGNLSADVMFIGEAPGEQEDLAGQPFVGPAGKLLLELLESIGMERSQVYITNIVKYRPPDNREPFPQEKHAGMELVRAEIAVVDPKVVCLLGAHSLSMFFPDRRVSLNHGDPIYQYGRHWLPFFHPAAALYDSSKRDVLFTDFAAITKVLDAT